jgi:hypothetical protein
MQNNNFKLESQGVTNLLDNIERTSANIAKVESKLFTAIDYRYDAPNLPQFPDVSFERPDAINCYNSRTGKFIGVTRTNYESLQPKTFLDTIVRSATECGVNIDLSKLTYHVLKGGQQIEFRVPLYKFEIQTGGTAKVGDITQIFISFRTGFGGYGKTVIGLFAYRLICTNGMTIRESMGEIKSCKHTVNMNVKALLFCSEIADIANLAVEKAEMWAAMAAKPVSISQVTEFSLAMLKINKSATEVSTKKANQLHELTESIALELSRTGNNVFGLMQGGTHYANHKITNAGELDSLLIGTGASLNDDAQRLAYALLN